MEVASNIKPIVKSADDRTEHTGRPMSNIYWGSSVMGVKAAEVRALCALN